MKTGPDIIRDGLVFGYDTGYPIANNENALRFSKGEPVDNEFYNSGEDGNILSYSTGYGGYGTLQSSELDAFGTTDNAVYRNTGKIRFGPTGGQDIGTLIYGKTYTFSIYLKHVVGETESSDMEFDICDRADSRSYSGTLGSNMTYDWKRFSVTALHNNSSNYHFLDLGTYQGTNVFDWCCPQIEESSHASPFTNTERSSTQSLIDLKRNTNIDVSNVSFDSNAQMNFDGTDDYIPISTYTFGNGNWTVSMWVNADNINVSNLLSNTSGGPVCNAFGFDSSKIHYRNYDGAWKTHNGNTTLSTGEWYHLTWVNYEGASAALGTMKMYVDGVADSSVFNSYVTNGGPCNAIGSNWFSTFNGKITNCYFYNKALTDSQIKQNFNASKKRFGI